MTQTLNKFEVTNCTTKVTPDTLNLAISLKRLSGPFWHSLFVPSICLILAAEVTLFINEEHFEVLLMVSLTSNLVMYTMYSAIEEKLPDNSSFKLIDVWLLHGLLMPMVVFTVHVAREVMNKHAMQARKRPVQVSPKTPKMIKFDTSTSKVATWNPDTRDTFCSGREKCKLACKIIIPTTSFLFVIAFFAICLKK